MKGNRALARQLAAQGMKRYGTRVTPIARPMNRTERRAMERAEKKAAKKVRKEQA